MFDIHAIDSGNAHPVPLLIIIQPLAKVPVGLTQINVVAAAITARSFFLLHELQCDIEIVEPEIFAQGKAVTVIEQNHTPYY